MNLDWCNVHYSTRLFDDKAAGCIRLELWGTAGTETTAIGTVTFWDAQGQFFIELTGQEVPLSVVEQFIAEAREAIEAK